MSVSNMKIDNSSPAAKIYFVSHKHWSAYILPIFLIFFSFPYLFSKVSIISLIIIIACVLKIIGLKSAKCTLSSDGLFVKYGWLPWSKTNLRFPIYNIYEAYVTFGMFGRILGYGNILIKKTDGQASSTPICGFNNAKALAAAINELVHKHKMSPAKVEITNPVPQSINSSLSEELKRLAELKENGIISEEDFKNFKNKLLG